MVEHESGRVLLVVNRLPLAFPVHAGLRVVDQSIDGLTSAELECFYDFCNGTLWPVFHGRVDHVSMSADAWDAYERINNRFADLVASVWKPGDTIRIHDYQLLRLPILLRDRIPDARIDFFLHFPFPDPDGFLSLPVARRLVDGLLASDFIGFHGAGHRNNFAALLGRFGLVPPTLVGEFAHAKRSVRFGVFSLDVDSAGVGAAAIDCGICAELLRLKSVQDRSRLTAIVRREEAPASSSMLGFAALGAGICALSMPIQPPLDEYLLAAGLTTLTVATLTGVVRWLASR